MQDKKPIYAALLLSVILVSAYVFVLYSYRNNAFYTFLPLAAMLVCAFLINYIWGDMFFNRFKITAFKRLFFPLIFISVYSMLTYLKEGYVKYQLEKNGVTVNGIVVDCYQSTGRRNTYYYAKLNIGTIKQIYRQTLSNPYHSYKYHDDLRILCPSNDAEIFKIVEHTPGLNISFNQLECPCKFWIG